jgi:hypothetical protein
MTNYNFAPLKLSVVLQVAPRIVNTLTLAFQTTKTFQKCTYCRNMAIILLPRVIFQLKNNKN